MTVIRVSSIKINLKAKLFKPLLEFQVEVRRQDGRNAWVNNRIKIVCKGKWYKYSRFRFRWWRWNHI